ncbi:MAG: bifunctional UDP-N-acetylglucosamine diphosphorylase/glucosamine-1-phosphate N-acetyltransferase GlmU [Nitrospirota bacterium]|nr:bifunctional UDP-N-acetylglucosamine diphosphorylase/glucosamine-1-phosphate N-acetyltransferase GlmU [Nitrospirota bacterium]
MKHTSAIIMAAGLGTRMRSKTVKVLHQVAGRPMVWYMVSLARQVADGNVVAVLGHQSDRVKAFFTQIKDQIDPIDVALQTQQLGTGHAVLQAKTSLMDQGRAVAKQCLILNGDTPLLTRETVQLLLAQHEQEQAMLTMLTARLDNPKGYGRVVRGFDNHVTKVVEDRDATSQEIAIQEVTVGTYVVNTQFLFEALDQLSPNNAQGEYYLTDIIGMAVSAGHRVSAVMAVNEDECMGINTREQLAYAERVMRQRMCTRWMLAGVTMIDPATTLIDEQVTLGQDTILYPGVTLEGATKIGDDCVIRAHSRITNSTIATQVRIEDHCIVENAVVESMATVGPFARLRPGAVLRSKAKVGNFVELKNAELGQGAKANHLTYLGDATIGQNVNIGAGTITCNYDGYRKEKTIIEDDVFIGSDTQFIAPIVVGKGAVVGAGSTITRNVPPGALTLSRSEQVNHEGWAEKRRAYHDGSAKRDGAKGQKSLGKAPVAKAAKSDKKSKKR